MPTIPLVTATLDQITRSGARPGSNYCSTTSADQAPNHGAANAANNGSLGTAMMVIPTVSLTCHPSDGKGAEYQSDTQEQHRNRTFFIY
jgi:hypothetical protein